MSKYTFWNLEDIKEEKEKRWDSSPAVEATYFDDVLTINIEGYGAASINVLDYARDVLKQYQDEKPPYMIAQLSSSDPIRVQVKFSQIEFKHYKPEQEEERYALVRFNFEALLDY